MGMVVRTNVMAVNANRQLGMNNSQVGKSLEKLASGFRINRAGDDASGLAISEKMKAQIRGLETASANSQDGISLIQTAEGALTEVHDMLNRMVELAGKAANGTMEDNVDREALQEELNSLRSEIDRISRGTNFNGKTLLDGSLSGNSSVLADQAFGSNKVTFGGGAALEANSATIAMSRAASTTSANGIDITVSDAATPAISITLKDGGSYTAKQIEDAVRNFADAKVKDGTAAGLTNAEATETYEALRTFTFKSDGAINPTTTTTGVSATAFAAGGSRALNLQVGDTNDTFNKVSVAVDSMDSIGLGIDTISVEDETQAGNSIQHIKDAINKVSTNRANLGALQNRLEHTINNLDVATENLTSANSRIRDTDMAKQMMDFTKMNVLTQAAQAMLAQANMQPQSVLQLLQ